MRRALKVLGIVVIAVMGLVVLAVVAASAVYTPEYVYRVLAWRESDSFDWQKFPFHPLEPAGEPHHFAEAPDPRVEALFEEISGAEDWDAFLAEKDTQAFIVIRDGKVVYENYFNDTQRDSIVTSFSMQQVLSKAWVDESTAPLLPENYDEYYTRYDDLIKTMPGQGFYKHLWWGMAREDGAYNFSAGGDRGQYIYVSPGEDLIIVRNGIDRESLLA